MAKICAVCGKAPKKAASRSHALNKTLRRQKPNLQKVNGQFICTRCLRTMAKRSA